MLAWATASLTVLLLVTPAWAEPHGPEKAETLPVQSTAIEITMFAPQSFTWKPVPPSPPVLCLGRWERLMANGKDFRYLTIASTDQPAIHIYIERDDCGQVRFVVEP